MATVLLTGGTGHLGRDLSRTLVSEGHRVRIFARHAGPDRSVEWVIGDLATGSGLQAAVEGIDTVIHAATFSPIARRGMRPVDFFFSPQEVDVDGTRLLLAAAESARIQHFIFVSIVDLEASALPYSRIKLAAETLVKASSLPWSVVRATPFYYLLAGMFKTLAWSPIWLVPRAFSNPVDTKDVAAYLGACVVDGRRGLREQIGGPQTLPFANFARQYRDAAHLRRLVLSFPVGQKLARRMGIVQSSERRGANTWGMWLREHALDGSS